MGSTLSIQVEEFINEAGKVPRVQVYRRFELVGKRFVDQALEELAQSRRLVVGASDVAPVRDNRRPAAVQAAGQLATHQDDEPPLPERLVALLQAQGTMSLASIMAALDPPAEKKHISTALGRLKARDIVGRVSRGQWALVDPDRGLPIIKNQIIAVFEPGVMLTRAEIGARIPTMKPNSLSTELCRLVRVGRLAHRRCHGYWLPGTVS